MWRFTPRITVAVLTFIIGIAVTMIWFIYNSRIDRSVARYVPPNTSLTLCDLIRNSSDYDSKIVRVRAMLVGYHEIVLYDSNCKSEENYVRADFDSTSRQKLIDAISTLNGVGFLHGNFEARVVLTGRFEKLQDKDDKNKVEELETNQQPVKYFSRLIVLDIEHVEVGTDDVSKP
jgi:hypothetical protein